MVVKMGGKAVKVDRDDFHLFSEMKFYLWKSSRGSFYVRSTDRKSLHRMILGLKKGDGIEVDHVDGNPLNNTRKNLRIATRSQNHYNAGKSRRNTSGHKGVYWDKHHQKWRAQIFETRSGEKKDKTVFLGYYDDILEAAKAYEEGSKHIAGEFARWW